jgi:K+-transporting ATPase ATPase A chain
MIGRTPEYLGKKITARETRLAVLYALLTPAVVLVLSAVAIATSAGRAGLVTNDGTRGFTEVIFAYASCMANNGQSMAGLQANSVFYNVTTALAMLAGRFGLAAIALRLAGHFAAQRRWPTTSGTLPSDSAVFGGLVLATVVLVGALSFLPALALGPVAEALQH